MRTVSDEEARQVRSWLDAKGMRFDTGSNEETELTDAQILQQCKMYLAAVRIADDFGCDGIGIQYQQGLKDICPASDLVEGILNNVDRPPVTARDNGRVLYEGQALPHFNEVDECAGLDALITNRLWTKMGFPPETTLHDVRWGEQYEGRFVWVFEISGSVPPEHLIGGYAGAVSERQPPMYFPLGGGTIKGISKPGWVVWSRIFVADGKLNADMGVAESNRTAPGRDRAALAGDHAAVAHHACGDAGRRPRQDDGAAQVEPYPGGVRAGEEGRDVCAGGEAACLQKFGDGCVLVRRGVGVMRARPRGWGGDGSSLWRRAVPCMRGFASRLGGPKAHLHGEAVRHIPTLAVAALLCGVLGCGQKPQPVEAPEPEPILLVSQKADKSVAWYTLGGELLAETLVSDHPHEIVRSADGTRLYVTDNGVMQIENAGEGGHKVSVIDMAAREKVSEIDLGQVASPARHRLVRRRNAAGHHRESRTNCS